MTTKATAPAAMLTTLALVCATTDAAQPGDEVLLTSAFHEAGGVVTVVDHDTIRVDLFTYNGHGISVFWVLSTRRYRYADGLLIGDDFVTRPQDGTSFEIDLPAGTTIDQFTAISFHCVVADVSFADGVFGPAAPPGDATLDGRVNIDDVALVLLNFGKRLHAGDVNKSGFTDLDDLQIVLNNFGIGTT